MFQMRCQEHANGGQCALTEGHAGYHATEQQIAEQDRRNRNPTLMIFVRLSVKNWLSPYKSRHLASEATLPE